MDNTLFEIICYLAVLIALAIPLGAYIASIYRPEGNIVTRKGEKIERALYKLVGMNADAEMSAKQYTASALAFSLISLLALFLLLLIQKWLPLNPNKIGNCDAPLAFNIAASFVTNTNWQSIVAHRYQSYFSDIFGMTVQNFVSAAVGLAVLLALTRGFVRAGQTTIGNFWKDTTRAFLYILLPISFIVALLLVSQGVVQTFSADIHIPAVGERAGQVIPLGPAASQIAIKQLGTNGGGFFGRNAAFPLENPTPFSNLVEMISILLIPAALCFAFGALINKQKQGVVIFITMTLFLVGAIFAIYSCESASFTLHPLNGETQPILVKGNMEGKETRFGIPSSAVWAAFTTAVSNGSVNAMHDSFTPLGGMIPLMMMQLGEIIFGGIGSGLYGMLCFIVLTVFIAGLMVGRTPEFLGKKIEPFEMKMAVIGCLTSPILILVGAGIATAFPSIAQSLTNSGPHGFSEILYAFTSAGMNNGSAFEGFNANRTALNIGLGVLMLMARFIPIAAVLAMAGSLAKKRKIAVSPGTLSTTSVLFVVLLIIVIFLIGALNFIPALSLGPIAEFFL